jgi:hypothetical protein
MFLKNGFRFVSLSKDNMNTYLFVKYLENNDFVSINNFNVYYDIDKKIKFSDTFAPRKYVHIKYKTAEFGFVLYYDKIFYISESKSINNHGYYYSTMYGVKLLNLINENNRIVMSHEQYYNNIYHDFKKKYLLIMQQLEKELIESRWHPSRIKKWLESNKDKDVSDYEYLYAV